MTLEEVRHDIDRVDGEIKKLFEERIKLSDEVAKVKAETADDIYKPDREELIIERLTEGVPGDILREYTALIKRIMEISRKYQYGRTLELRDAFRLDYDSEMAEISNVAVLENEKPGITFFDDMKVTAVKDYETMAGLVEGTGGFTGMGFMEEIGIGVSDEFHNMFRKHDIYIQRCDLVHEGDVTKKLAYVGKRLVVSPDHNRLKLMFVCKNRSGSLASVLSMIADYGINLTEIHSKPDKKEEWNYYFMVELDANILNKETTALVFQLTEETQYLRIMGSYRI